MTLPSDDGLLSRRSLIKVTALAAVPFMIRATPSRAADITGGLIDAHVHVWPAETTRYPVAEGFKKENVQPISFTPEELFAECRPQGVTRVVLIQMSFYKFDNSYMLDAIRQYPDAFRGVAIVDEKQANVGDTMKELAKSGVTGFRLYATKPAVESWLNATEMNAFWKLAAQTGQAVCLLSDPDALPAIDAMIKKHPETTVVIDHFSRIGMSGTIQQQDLDNLCRLARYPNVFVKTSAFYALGKKQAPYTDLGPMVRRLRDAYGAKRLMWASDCPFQVQGGHTYGESISLIRDKLDFLTQEEKSWILAKTAENVYWTSSNS
ncbi:MAG TPA: amidohydrolase family protein [Planctomicrobium sp.]|nr:amidohydrolase family protein [Planctomicrobium sp.]